MSTLSLNQIERRLKVLNNLLNGTITSRRHKAAIARYATDIGEQKNPYERIKRRQRHFERYMDLLCARTGSTWRS